MAPGGEAAVVAVRPRLRRLSPRLAAGCSGRHPRCGGQAAPQDTQQRVAEGCGQGQWARALRRLPLRAATQAGVQGKAGGTGFSTHTL